MEEVGEGAVPTRQSSGPAGGRWPTRGDVKLAKVPNRCCIATGQIHSWLVAGTGWRDKTVVIDRNRSPQISYHYCYFENNWRYYCFLPPTIGCTGTALGRLRAHRYASISGRKWRRLRGIVGPVIRGLARGDLPPSAIITFPISTPAFAFYYPTFLWALMRKCILMQARQCPTPAPRTPASWAISRPTVGAEVWIISPLYPPGLGGGGALKYWMDTHCQTAARKTSWTPTL